MIKIRRWFKRLTVSNRSSTRYRALCSSLSSISSTTQASDFEFSSVENLYEEISKFSGADLRDHVAYNLYLRQYFFALRDSRLKAKRSNDEMFPPRNAVDKDVQTEQYQFGEGDLLKRPRGRVCSTNLPRICDCSCDMVWQKASSSSPSPSFASWDAGWVFRGDERDMRKLARRSCERIKDRLFDGADGC